ncbi:single-stranded DNA-binding protein [Dietzia sp.]|uniref:single-stranded DNA-binding protein n=1 Tax=Dietzia sp. TaxID=1871616 RepID=UPI002FDA272C
MIVNRTHATVRGRVIATYPITSTNNGSGAVLNFRVAANERQLDPATNSWVDKDTFYVTVTCWDSLARRAAAVPLRGQIVVAIGTLASRHYEKDGERRNYTELRAQHVAVDLGSVESVRAQRAPGNGEEGDAGGGAEVDNPDTGSAAAGVSAEQGEQAEQREPVLAAVAAGNPAEGEDAPF